MKNGYQARSSWEQPAGLTNSTTRRLIMNAQYLLKALVCCMLAALTAPAKAQNVSVTDYQVPVSRVDNLRIDVLSFNLTTEGKEVIHEQGEIGLVYKKFYSSLPFAYFIDALSSASYFRQFSFEDSERTGTYDMKFDVQVQKYFRETNKFFYFVSPEILMRKGFDRPETDVFIGLGYGRFINATALRKAVRIEDFLFEEGVISDFLPKDTMIALGQIIEKEDDYRNIYGDRTYRIYWYEDLSSEIDKTGLVTGGGNIGPIGILRMREVLKEERISDRFFGWDVNAGVQYQLQTRNKDIDRAPPALAINVRYSRPISWRMQVNTDFKLDTPFKRDYFRREYNISQNVDFIYEITNKIAFVSSNTLHINKKRDGDARFRHNSNISFTFFIENKISLTAIEQISKEEGSSFRQSLLFALSYRIF